jgi:Ca2+-binding RTX toxin-like protein
VMKVNGTGATQITDTSTAKTEPTWSPDGTRIAYVANSFDIVGQPNQSDFEIWTINADGSGRTQVTNNTFADSQPAWSPDGTQIAFVSARTGDTNRNIYVMDANAPGSGAAIDTDAAHDISPDWQPNPPTCDVSGTNGDNILTGNPAEDEVICGLGGNDTISGQDGDILMGGDGNDMLAAAAGRATFNGAAGADTASFAGSATDIEASLISEFARRVGTNPLEGVALVGIERLTGSDLDDVLTGSNGANKLVGGDGADQLLALGGKDTLNSRDGVKRNDTVNGGPGRDKCVTDKREASIKSC